MTSRVKNSEKDRSGKNGCITHMVPFVFQFTLSIVATVFAIGPDPALFKVSEMAKIERAHRLPCGEELVSLPSEREIRDAINNAHKDPNEESALQELWIQVNTHKIMRSYLNTTAADRHNIPLVCHDQDEFDEIHREAQSTAYSNVPKGTAGMMSNWEKPTQSETDNFRSIDTQVPATARLIEDGKTSVWNVFLDMITTGDKSNIGKINVQTQYNCGTHFSHVAFTLRGDNGDRQRLVSQLSEFNSNDSLPQWDTLNFHDVEALGRHIVNSDLFDVERNPLLEFRCRRKDTLYPLRVVIRYTRSEGQATVDSFPVLFLTRPQIRLLRAGFSDSAIAIAKASYLRMLRKTNTKSKKKK